MRELVFSVTAKDCEWQTFSVGGAGGSGKDTSNSGVRCTHRPSGATAVARESRSQVQNRRLAFRRMAESNTFRSWARAKALVTAGRRAAVEQQVAELMAPRHLLVECKRDGKWTKCEEGGLLS